MRSCVAIFIYSFSFIRWIDAQTDLWYEQMNIDPQTSSGWSGTVPNYNTVADAECPGTTNDFCWSFISTAASYQRSADTSQYVSVQLTYSINTFDLNGVEDCFIDYSVENIATPTAFTDIERINTGTGYTGVPDKTYNSWTDAAGIPKLTIRIGSDRAGVTCYFNEFRLSGVPITPQPTAPTAIPSLQPTAFPTKTPSRAPSPAPSGSPTAAPSGSPSQPPSAAPSDSPTARPSASPSAPPSAAPSISPTHATANPTDTPTATSTPPTRVPTRSPVYSAPVQISCGSYCTEYHLNIAPTPGVLTTRTISVQGVDPGAVDSSFRIYLTPKGHPCTDPSITATFERIDYDGSSSESILVAATSGAFSTTCGSISNSCGNFASCVSNRNVGIIEIYPEHETQIITITRRSGVDAFCTAYHNWAINVQLTILCSARTANPTTAPTNAPSSAPTPPTNDPTTAPSGAPTSTPSGSPSQPPSTAPTTAPSAAPSHAPTSQTTLPTAAPSGSPTTPPSRAPSQPPSVAPSIAPTQPPSRAPSQPPTTAPSASPTAPSSTPSSMPTQTPTAITSIPTPSPTAMFSCGTYRTCYIIDVTPVSHSFKSVAVPIKGAYVAANSYYDVTFAIHGTICNRPSFDFTFEPTDNNSPGESLYIDYEGVRLYTCGGTSAYSSCGTFHSCASQHSVHNNIPIDIGKNVTISIMRSSTVDMQYCSHGLAVNAVLTFNCDDRTVSPTTDPTTAPTASPTAPTSIPTASPSSAPSAAPTAAPTIQSNAPSLAPSSAPTAPPSTAPTSPPTTAPSGSPTSPPSSAPTSATLNPSFAPTKTPTSVTATPTSAPTYRYACGGSYTYCYDRSITPIAGELVSDSINIQDTPGPATSYIYNLAVLGPVNCMKPSVDFSFEPIDNDNGGSENLVVQYDGLTVATCGTANACNTLYACLSGHSIASQINTGSTITVTVTKGSGVGAFCTSWHPWAINAYLNVSCNDQPTTATPTLFPTQVSQSPTVRPTNPPTMRKCSRTDATRCYQYSVYSLYTYTTWTRSIRIYNAHGYDTDVYDIYFTTYAGYNCYNPYINVRYAPVDDMNSVLILDKQERVLGSCTGAKRCAVPYRDCITNYDLGIEVLVGTKSYNLILFGRALANECNGTATIDAYVDFVCGMIPTTTQPPTGAPTTPTVPPTTGAPTQPTQDPTPYPTADYPDGGGSFGLFILSHEFNYRGSYSLIFMARSVQNVELILDTLVEWPLQRSAVQSIQEMKDDAFCVEDTNCTSFWNVMYTADCPLMLSGTEWKVQFETNCVYQDYGVKKRCLDYLQDNGVTDKRIILSTQNAFEIEDDLCNGALYSTEATLVEVRFYKHGKHDLIRSEGNLKYKEGDTVYLELEIVLSDPAFAVNAISYQNVFGCHQNETAFGVPLLTETKTGIGACVTSEKNYVLESSMAEGTQRLSFKIPRGVKSESEVFTIQIQAVLSIVQSNARRRGLLQEETVVASSDQVRYFMTSVVLNGRASAMGGGELSGGGIAAIIIAAVAVCIVIFVVIYCRKNKDENKEKRTQTELIAPKKLEAVKSVESVGSPQDTDGDIETGGIDLAEDEKPSKPKKKAPTRKELAKKKKNKPAAGTVATPMMLEMEEKKKKPESKPVAKKKVAAKKKGAVGAGAGAGVADEKKKKKKEAAAAGKAGAKGNAGAKKKAVAKGKGGKKAAPKKKLPDSGKKKKGTGGKKKKGFVE